MATWPVRHILFYNMHLVKLPAHFYRYNHLDAVCAKDLVKGDWPELRVLAIRWGDVLW
jgi:hypothetical protein